MRHPKHKLSELEARPRKSFSQNFLTSSHWVDKLALAACDAQADIIWEVGPGLGAITASLLKQSQKPLKVFEIDRKLAENLRREHPNLEIIEGDFLEADIASFAGSQKVSLLSNLPYHISTPILFKLLDTRNHFSRLVLTFQREVAERLKAIPRTPDYSGLSVLVQCCFMIESLGIIPPGAFYPAPKVDSEALILTPKPELTVNYKRLRGLVKQAFLHRRKKITSNLESLIPKKACAEFLVTIGLTPDARPEELFPKDFMELTKHLN